MSTSALEIGVIGLKSTNSLNLGADKSQEEQQVVNEALKVLKEQPGFRNSSVGLKVEDNDVINIFVEWDTVEDHIKFTKTDHYQPFLENWGTAIDTSKIKLVHAHPTKDPKESLSAPVTEVLWWYFAHDKVDNDFANKWSVFASKMMKLEGEGLPLHESSGWVDEEVEFKTESGETLKGKAFVALIGWNSIEDHMKLPQRPEFQEGIGAVRETVSAGEMYHVAVGKGGRKTW